jgi:maltooligosyltrehalose trehalohydrolase
VAHRLRVWAPRAAHVDVVVAGRRSAMVEEGGGWLVADAGPVEPGADYAFSLDGGPALPDPRSRFQAEGVHGPSRLVDAAAFPWRDQAWQGRRLEDSVVYELCVGTFSPQGTFDGVIERLPHLVELGVGAIELMPVAAFPGERGWGYDGVDLYAVHRTLGGPEGLRRLVDAAHQAGLAVILDAVYNHLGPDGNHLGAFGPYFTDRYHTPWGSAINYDDRGSDEVRDFVLDNVEMWLREYHLDGLRLDAVHAILDTSATHILEAIAGRVRSLEAELRRRLWVIAESDSNDPRLVSEVRRGGYGLDAQWSDDFHHALWALLSGERGGYYGDFGSLDDVVAALRQTFVYDGRHSAYRGKRHGRSAVGLARTRFFGYLQNHDQVGNRAQGERSAAVLTEGLCRVAAALVLAGPFLPMLFAGEEWGARTPFLYFTDHRDPELGRAVAAGRRAEFAGFGFAEEDVPDPQAEATFLASKLDWSEPGREPHASLLRWHQDLLRLRREQPALRDGRLDAVRSAAPGDPPWLLLERGPVAVAANLSRASVRIPLGQPASRRVLLASADVDDVSGTELALPAESAVIYSRQG